MKYLKSIYLVGAITLAIAAGTVVGYSRDRQGNGRNNNSNNGGQNGRNGNQYGGGQTNGGYGGGYGRNGGAGEYDYYGQQNRRNNDRNNDSTIDRNNGRNADRGEAATSNDRQRNGRQTDNSEPKQADTEKNNRENSRPDADSRQNVDSRRNSEPALTRHNTRNGYEETTASGKVRTRAVKENDGEHVTKFNAIGKKQSEEVDRADGSKQVSRFDATGRERQQEVDHADGSREVSNRQYGRDGNVRTTETVKYDVHQKIVSKSVTRIVNKTVIVNNYDCGRYGYVYHPVFVMAPLVAWYDPYWYTPAGVVIVHPFHYAWGWDGGWYHAYYGPYWVTYDVYPTPSYWVTDWMVASYLQDHYEAQASIDQAREEARIAREDADKAAQAAQAAQDQAEIADAKAAQAQAELRAKNAEAKLAEVEKDQAQAGKPNPNATPIDKDTKEALKTQIDQTIAENKTLAEQQQKGETPVLPDVSKALADPKHIYPVSKVISVTSAKDSTPAGNLSEGDLLKVEPGQEDKLKNPSENDLITMRVMTSKGDDGEVQAGTLVSVSVHDLQDFDSEFRAKLDAGLEAADKNKDQFKQGATGTAGT